MERGRGRSGVGRAPGKAGAFRCGPGKASAFRGTLAPGETRSGTCGVDTLDLAGALAARVVAASRAPGAQHSRLVVVVTASPVHDRTDRPASASASASAEPPLPSVFAECNVGEKNAREIVRRALPLGSRPFVTDVQRLTFADGSVLEKSRPSASYEGTRGDAVSARAFPPAHQKSCEVCVGAAAADGAGVNSGEGAPFAAGYFIVASSAARRGDPRPLPCSGAPKMLERLQRIEFEVSGAVLVVEFGEGGGASAYVDADSGASRSSVRRALLPLAFLLKPDEAAGPEAQEKPGGGRRPRGGAAAAVMRAPSRPPSAGGGAPRRGRRTSIELPPPD